MSTGQRPFNVPRVLPLRILGLLSILSLAAAGAAVAEKPAGRPAVRAAKPAATPAPAKTTVRPGTRPVTPAPTAAPSKPSLRPAAPPSATTAVSPARLERVQIPIRTAKGRRYVTAVVRNGIAIYQGDIELGDPADTTDRSLGMADEDLRWPGAVVPYFLSSQVSDNAVESTLRQAMAHIEQRTPIRFIEQTTPVPNCSPGALVFDLSPTPDVSSSKVGFQGGCQYLRLWPDHQRGVAIHELGHALGLKHEQSRPDRDAWVQVLWQNIEPDARGNFGILDDDEALDDLTPYDYGSVMHYGSNNFCIRNPVTGQCVGPTLQGRSNPNQAFGGEVLSPHDANLLSLMYARVLGENESGDGLGTAIALGDFDNDGFSDLVMGAPQERLGSGVRGGAIYYFKGTSAEPAPWAVLTERTPPAGGEAFANSEEGDELGASLVAADFDNDGFTDLAAGTPNKAPGNGPRSGGVMLYRGTPGGLVGWTFLSLGDLGLAGVAGDRFGASLAAIWLTKGSPQLVVGAPGRGTHGAVYVVYVGWLQAGVARPFAELLPDASPGAARFGTTLEVADLNGDGKRDLAVGAPDWGANGAGSVYLFMGNGTRALTRLQNITDPAGVRGDDFGFAIAAASVVPGNDWIELVVGAPGKKQGAVATGAVMVFARRNGGMLPSFAKVDDIYPGSTTDPQRFGHTLATGMLVGNATLEVVVGAPGFDGGAGRVVILTPRDGKLANVRDVRPGAIMPQPRFGSAIAAGTMKVWPGPLHGEPAQDPTFFVGAPAAALGPAGATAGLVYAYNSAPTDSFLRARIHQERSTPWSAD
jgi:hypothetical protein